MQLQPGTVRLPLLFGFVCLMLVACTQGEKGNRNEQNSSSPVGDLSEDEKARYLEKGLDISSQSQQTLMQNVMAARKRGGVPEALKYCNVRAYELVDSLSAANGAHIKRASHRARNPADAPTMLEKEIISQYLTVLQSNGAPRPRIELTAGGDSVAFFRPIVLNNPACLACHGEPGREIKPEHVQLIRELYPKGNAMGHKKGDLRGVWSITFKRQ